MARLTTVADTSALLHLKQNHLAGWLFVAVGAGLCFLPSLNRRIDEPWLVYLVGGLFIAIGLLVAFYRVDVRLDLAQRRFHIIMGFWPRPREHSGGFDTIEGLWFERQWRSSGGKSKTKYVVWQTGLKVAGFDETIGLHESRDEVEARQWFERRARQLRVKTKDFTGATPDERNWERLDDPATARLADTGRGTVAVDLSRPPRGLTVQHDSGGLVYALAPPGWTFGVTVGVLVGLPFAAFGVMSLMLGLDLHEYLGWQIEVSGPRAIAIGLGATFVFAGGAIIKLSIDHARSERRFMFGVEAFCYSVRVGNRIVGEDRMKYADIEAFDLRDSTARRRRQSIAIGDVGVHRWASAKTPELFVRTDRKVVTIRDLHPEVAAFLVGAFHTHGARRAVFDARVS